MIPFAPQPSMQIGSRHVTAFGALIVAGILVGRTVLMRRARRFGISHAEIAPLYLIMLVAGLAGAVIAQAFMSRAGFTMERGLGLASIGGLGFGIAAGVLFCTLKRWTFARSLMAFDIIAFAVPFASCVARLGCALAHDHRGLPSESWLAVRFPEGPRWDLGLLEFLFLAALSLLFLLLDRTPHRPGFFIAIAGVLYGAFRIWRETLDVTPHFTPWAVVMLIGAAVWFYPSVSRIVPNRSSISWGRV